MAEPANPRTVPRAFLSHASEDKARFTDAFAERLRAAGVDVWYDTWELLPGDSLVDKIFEEGLKEAAVVIVVVSAISITKPWVREELNSAVVARIERQAKLIPVVIDDCEVPEVLKTTAWQRIADHEDYDGEFDRILRAVFDERTKPELGEPPTYANAEATGIDGLAKSDSLVLKAAGDLTLKTDLQMVQTRAVLETVEPRGLSEDALLESLEILEHHGYATLHKTLASGLDGVSSFLVSTAGLHAYATAFIEGYEETVTAVAAYLVNHNGGRASDARIADALSQPRVLVENILDLFEMQGWIELAKTSGPLTAVITVNPQLRRELEP